MTGVVRIVTGKCVKMRKIEEGESKGDGTSPAAVVMFIGSRKKNLKEVMDKGKNSLVDAMSVEVNKRHCRWATIGKRRNWRSK